ncbi:MAG: cytochrome c-type biogenesis protein CcmH [Gammaproteobacteria bacterium]|nr:cytochrome c-type biogenesis protein CcmH [Gammaproteobacteria bacterium]
MNKLIFILMVIALSFHVHAMDQNPEEFSDPDQEQRYKNLLEELRCVVCQNQSLADSNADLAQDLRDEVRAMVNKGESDTQITDFLVTRYGEFVLYRPPLKSSTYLLWIGPPVLLVIALAVMLFMIRRHKQAPRGLDQDERDKLKQILGDKDMS